MANKLNDDFDILRSTKVPQPSKEARDRALHAALAAFDDAAENNAPRTQGNASGGRLTDRTFRFWREVMQKKLIAVPAFAGLVALPIAGVIGWQLMDELRPDMTLHNDGASSEAAETTASGHLGRRVAPQSAIVEDSGAFVPSAISPRSVISGEALIERSARPGYLPQPVPMMVPSSAPSDGRERFANGDTNPLKVTAEAPVSTFSIDVDTASYAFVRRSLREGVLPLPESVRVEELINYFPYDWQGPSSASVPFNTRITVMPTPWNENTQLMHVAIKGYEINQTAKPRSNLVFLVDVSGSMNEPDKLPLLKNSFRLLLDKLDSDDTVSIVTYAGRAGTALEPTKVSEKQKILQALDHLEAGGSTAGEDGLRQAYQLAESSFVEGGVNRVMLATDGDFNVGQTSDDDLKRLIEDKRESGVLLSVLGFGRGNLNDRMMQTIAQNGNGIAAYIDTLSEAEKVLVQEASSSLFTIAQDVKIQVEFNPQKVAEYRLIGYETRALAREDFNNDRVDAGDIGSGHSVTAIYEITPVGSPARMTDELRYGGARTQGSPAGEMEELAFVKLRYKQPGEAHSKLIETPVTEDNVVARFDEAGESERFSAAVAAFGQKLRRSSDLSSFGYDQIIDIANASRGADPYGYRAEFLSLVRLAAALDAK